MSSGRDPLIPSRRQQLEVALRMLNDLVSDPVGAALKMDPGCTAQFVEQFASLVPSTAEFEAARRCCGDGPLLTVTEDFVLRCGRVPDLCRGFEL